MDFKEYQDAARKTAVYPVESQVLYPALGIAGESGEVCEKIKKQIRDHDGILDDEIFIMNIKKECGDLLWYISNLASDLNIRLEDIAEINIDKLADRQKRGVLHGNGDSR